MKRTTISLPDEVWEALRREAGRRRVSQSEVVREVLSRQFGFDGRRRRIPFAAIGSSGRADLAERTEEIIREEILPAVEEDAFGGRRR